MTFKTEQEAFWAGNFGTEYIQRNQGDTLLASNLDFFAKALRQARSVKSCIEFGANIGMNLNLLPVAGLPLPFISFGGSALLMTMFSAGVLLNISQHASAA